MKEIKQGAAGMALLIAITLVFFFVADLKDRLRYVDQPFGWWISRQIERIF